MMETEPNFWTIIPFSNADDYVQSRSDAGGLKL
jgi:hypothetical protein